MKLLLSTLCLVIFLGLATSTSRSNNRYWGRRNPSDHLLLRKNVARSRMAPFPVRVHYPGNTIRNKNKTISAIYAFDLSRHGLGAVPTLWSGGPGEKYATVILRSLSRKDINSTVEFWGQ